MTKRNTRK